MRGIKFKIWKGERVYFFHIVGSNGEIMAPSEGYSRLANAHRAVTALWKGFAKATGFLDFLESTGRTLPSIPYTEDSLRPIRLSCKAPGAR